MKKIIAAIIVGSVLMTSCSKDLPGGNDVVAAAKAGEDNPNGGGGNNTVNVPSAVLAAFNTRYPDATNIQWKKLSDGNYKAEFYRGGVKWQAIFTPAGSLVKEEHV
ncbi:MAG TPA: hypothetical protein VK166_14105 [Chitinophagaceae bacterium]|nr:hypothetical protein [Chitinophagaceae bacterium]